MGFLRCCTGISGGERSFSGSTDTAALRSTRSPLPGTQLVCFVERGGPFAEDPAYCALEVKSGFRRTEIADAVSRDSVGVTETDFTLHG